MGVTQVCRWCGDVIRAYDFHVQECKAVKRAFAEVERLRDTDGFMDDVMADAVSVAWQEGYDDDGDPRTPEYGVGFEGDTPD